MNRVEAVSPSLYYNVAEPVTAVAGRRGPAHVDYEDKLILIRPFHKDANKEDVPRAEHHLALPVRMPVWSVLVQSHLSDEVSFLGRQGQVYHTADNREIDREDVQLEVKMFFVFPASSLVLTWAWAWGQCPGRSLGPTHRRRKTPHLWFCLLWWRCQCCSHSRSTQCFCT